MNDIDKRLEESRSTETTGFYRRLEGIKMILNAVVEPNSSVVTMQRSNAEWLISTLKSEREEKERYKKLYEEYHKLFTGF